MMRRKLWTPGGRAVPRNDQACAPWTPWRVNAYGVWIGLEDDLNEIIIAFLDFLTGGTHGPS